MPDFTPVGGDTSACDLADVLAVDVMSTDPALLDDAIAVAIGTMTNEDVDIGTRAMSGILWAALRARQVGAGYAEVRRVLGALVGPTP